MKIIFLFLLNATLCLISGCEQTTSSKPDSKSSTTSQLKSKPKVKNTSDSLACLSELKAMLSWYGSSQSQADTIHQFHFVGRSTAKHKNAYYVVNEQEVIRYLNFLKGSGFFSNKFIEIERNSLENLRVEYAKKHVLVDSGEPTDFVLDRLIGVTNADDILNYNHYPKSFKKGSKEHTLLFETGESNILFTFDNDCKITDVEF